MRDINGIVKIIYDAVDEVNLQLPKDRQIEKSLDTELSGPNGSLDSLSMVLLVVQIEKIASDESGIPVSLTGEELTYQQENPFGTIRSLAEYIFELIKDRQNIYEQI